MFIQPFHPAEITLEEMSKTISEMESLLSHFSTTSTLGSSTSSSSSKSGKKEKDVSSSKSMKRQKSSKKAEVAGLGKADKVKPSTPDRHHSHPGSTLEREHAASSLLMVTRGSSEGLSLDITATGTIKAPDKSRPGKIMGIFPRKPSVSHSIRPVSPSLPPVRPVSPELKFLALPVTPGLGTPTTISSHSGTPSMPIIQPQATSVPLLAALAAAIINLRSLHSNLVQTLNLGDHDVHSSRTPRGPTPNYPASGSGSFFLNGAEYTNGGTPDSTYIPEPDSPSLHHSKDLPSVNGIRLSSGPYGNLNHHHTHHHSPIAGDFDDSEDKEEGDELMNGLNPRSSFESLAASVLSVWYDAESYPAGDSMRDSIVLDTVDESVQTQSGIMTSPEVVSPDHADATTPTVALQTPFSTTLQSPEATHSTLSQKTVIAPVYNHLPSQSSTTQTFSSARSNLSSSEETRVDPSDVVADNKSRSSNHKDEDEVRTMLNAGEVVVEKPAAAAALVLVDGKWEPGPKLDWRSKLPAKPPKDEPSLLAVLRKSVGKDMSTLSMPVGFNEPISLTQKMAEEVEYADLLTLGAHAFDPIERLCHVVAFAVSGYACLSKRSSRKPFNPMLGETYDLITPNFRFVSEKTSHHPPAVASFVAGDGWTVSQTASSKNKLAGVSSLEIIPSGSNHVTFEKWGEKYSWTKPSSYIRNLLAGTKYIETQGDMVVTNLTNGDHCTLTFKEAGWGGSHRNSVSGVAYNSSKQKVAWIEGKWDSMLQVRYGSSSDPSHVLWAAHEFPPKAEECYGWPTFTVALNELHPAFKDKLPPTDSRFNPSQRLLEEGSMEAADVKKAELESAQRARKAHRAEKGEEWTPRWFTKTLSEDGQEEWTYNGGYFAARESGAWPEDPGLFRTS